MHGRPLPAGPCCSRLQGPGRYIYRRDCSHYRPGPCGDRLQPTGGLVQEAITREGGGPECVCMWRRAVRADLDVSICATHTRLMHTRAPWLLPRKRPVREAMLHASHHNPPCPPPFSPLGRELQREHQLQLAALKQRQAEEATAARAQAEAAADKAGLPAAQAQALEALQREAAARCGVVMVAVQLGVFWSGGRGVGSRPGSAAGACCWFLCTAPRQTICVCACAPTPPHPVPATPPAGMRHRWRS